MLKFHFFQVHLKVNQSVSIFLEQEMFFVYISQAGAYSPFAGTPRLEPKHETAHTLILTAIQSPIGPLEVISGSRQT
jgi:hypothetical protein